MAAKWKKITPTDRFDAVVIPDANHKIDSLVAQQYLIDFILPLVRLVLQDSQQSQTESPVASFDQIVELISSGKAESIPGVKTIPLQVSRASDKIEEKRS